MSLKKWKRLFRPKIQDSVDLIIKRSARIMIFALAKFYHHHYQIRLLDGRHSLSELKNYLTKNNMEYMRILSQRRKTKINL